MSSVITENELTENIAANLVFLLEDRGVSRRQLAKEIDAHFTTICDLCHGRFAPGSYLLLKIATYFGVSVEDLSTSKIS